LLTRRGSLPRGLAGRARICLLHKIAARALTMVSVDATYNRRSITKKKKSYHVAIVNHIYVSPWTFLVEILTRPPSCNESLWCMCQALPGQTYAPMYLFLLSTRLQQQWVPKHNVNITFKCTFLFSKLFIGFCLNPDGLVLTNPGFWIIMPMYYCWSQRACLWPGRNNMTWLLPPPSSFRFLEYVIVYQ
jgi:hypothetical protein